MPHRHADITSTSVGEPVIVLGFGRSGTTWIADIVSRTTGKLILFEPLHPSVVAESAELAYGPLDEGSEPVVADLISAVLSGRRQEPWLLRNHLPVRVEEAPKALLDLLWGECEVLGYKAIRQNFQIRWLAERVSRRIAFVMRHPYGVAASILRRPNFWEFGWPGTFDLLMQKTVLHDRYDGTPLAGLRRMAERASTDVDRIALMWTATHLDALPALRDLGLTPCNYADFLCSPFAAARKLLADLAIEGAVHPAQLFSPSMTAEIPVVARHGLVAPNAPTTTASIMLTREDRLRIDRIVEPVYDLVDLGPFIERDALRE